MKEFVDRSDYIQGSHQDYTLQELGNAIHFLVKRASHRLDEDKRVKDFKDARAYLKIMESIIDKKEKDLGVYNAVH